MYLLYRPSKHIDIKGKYFQVPSFTPSQKAIPYARVNHNKYIVTDQTAMIGTSNWTPDYFLKTGGIGFVFSSNPKKENHRHNFIGAAKFKDKKYLKLAMSERKNFVESEKEIEIDDNVENMHTQLNKVFLRDWNSPYASDDV